MQYELLLDYNVLALARGFAHIRIRLLLITD